MAAQEPDSKRERRHPAEAEMEIEGENLDNIVANAVLSFNAFFGEGCWDFTLIDARPKLVALGAQQPVLWRATVSAYEEIK